jgi:hypothetical protein
MQLPDLLHALRHTLRERATARYHTEIQVWAALAPHQKDPEKPPKLPDILRT